MSALKQGMASRRWAGSEMCFTEHGPVLTVFAVGLSHLRAGAGKGNVEKGMDV